MEKKLSLKAFMILNFPPMIGNFRISKEPKKSSLGQHFSPQITSWGAFKPGTISQVSRLRPQLPHVSA